MTKPRPRCIDHEGNIIVLPERPPLWQMRPCQRDWRPSDIRKMAQSAYNAHSGKRMKITLAKEPWKKENAVEK